MLTANFTITLSGLTVTFTDNSVADRGGAIEDVQVAWGDGQTDGVDPGGSASHTYAGAGSYTIVSTVTDTSLATATSSQAVAIGGAGGAGGGGAGTGATTPSGSLIPVPSSGNYTVLSQRRTVQQIASGQVIDVESVGFQTTPHNVYCEVLVPLIDYDGGATANYVNPVATSIESLMSNQPVSSAGFTQDVDVTTNLLASFEDFVVAYRSPGGMLAQTTTVRVPVSSLADGDTLAAQQIQAAYQNLRQTAGL